MEISGNSKRRGMEDIITNLPRDVIQCILDHLPVRDAARTSTLSRKWRYIWASHPNLILDPKNMLGSPAVTTNDFVGIVNGILLQHIGPILTFNIDLPNVHITQYLYIDRWILHLSRNGLRKLTLDNSSCNLYALPSYIFLCQELSHLCLSKCIFKQPCGSKGSFHNLKMLYLTEVTFMPEVAACIFTASKLEHLNLKKCSGTDHLNFDCCSSSLTSLTLFENHGVKLSCFMNCKSITYAYLASPMQVESFGPGERISFKSLFENWPLISTLFLDGHHLKFLAAGCVTNVLPVRVNYLRDLILSQINFTDVKQISCILCLLHSSPGVHTLQISVKAQPVTAVNSLVCSIGDCLVSLYLLTCRCMRKDINSLKTLKIKYFRGSRAQMLFVYLILVCCPSLERITFEDNRVKASEVSNILKELLQFPRASRKAQIIF